MKRNKIILIIVGIVLLLCLASCGLLFYQMTPIDPHSKSGKQRLLTIIAISQPLTSALERYYHDHGSYPPDLAPLYPHYLSPSGKDNKKYWHNFGYSCLPEDDQTYSLGYNLGWDPFLSYRNTTHSKETKPSPFEPDGWVYDPGNGADKTSI